MVHTGGASPHVPAVRNAIFSKASGHSVNTRPPFGASTYIRSRDDGSVPRFLGAFHPLFRGALIPVVDKSVVDELFILS
jgi:hypothetical protein